MAGKDYITIVCSVLSGLVAVTALLLNQASSSYDTGIQLHERLVRIEEAQSRARRELDSFEAELKLEIRKNRDAIRDNRP